MFHKRAETSRNFPCGQHTTLLAETKSLKSDLQRTYADAVETTVRYRRLVQVSLLKCGPLEVRNAVPGGLPDVRNAVPGDLPDVRNAVPDGSAGWFASIIFSF